MDNLKEMIIDKVVAYQGAPGSYSHQCLIKNFEGSKSDGYTTFEGAINAVQNGNADYALLPVENSIAGRVMDIHHLLAHSGLTILAEYYQPIVHCLLAKEGAKLNKLQQAYSHPMALAQCRKFLHKNNISATSYTDTAEAAKMVSEQESLTIGAICASTNAELYAGLIILIEGIQDTDDNTTRFFLLAKQVQGKPSVQIKDATEYTTAIFFTVKNIPSALFKSLSGFATCGVNVTKLESFMPMHGNGNARFYVEIVGTPKDRNVEQALEELGHYSSKVEVLGTFETK